VEIVTDVAADGEERTWPFAVHRTPGRGELRQIARRCDAFVQINISLKALCQWPLKCKTFVAVHQGHYRPFGKPRPWRELVKLQIARHLAWNISVSKTVQDCIGCDGVVIPNCYDSKIFWNANPIRTKNIAYVGRLVSEKGVPVLLDAIRRLHGRKLTPSVTIVGDGPDRLELERSVQANGLTTQVTFVGSKPPAEVAQILNEHEILVVPSQYNEPFGIVALEGAACGCVVVGTSGGGLPEAIGPCGETFPNGDATALANVLERLLKHPKRRQKYLDAAPAHLEKHRPELIAARYIEFFRQVLDRRQSHETCV
jgi:glycosyltransferase involved in cell wall biosynthesis